MDNLSSPFSLITKSFALFFDRNNMIYFFKVYLGAFVLGAASYLFNYYANSMGYTSDMYFKGVASGNIFLIVYVVVWSLLSFVLGLWVTVAGYESVRRVVDGGLMDIKDTYREALGQVWKFFLLSMVMGIIILFGVLLLIVPAIIFGVWFCFAYWNLIVRKTGVIESLKLSKTITKGLFWKLFGRLFVFVLFVLLIQILLSFIPYNIGTLLFTIFGALFLLPYYLLYKEVENRNSI